ncbi:unnamed protein product [Adineta steineri]|uniref:Uncharacterized protein n=1 Tax=Adineta steineri TaxID=433720 RepID=A0A814XV50_9BILA|nr:unnamed protein product [Adineta steineri]CAF1513372.1 unnamed protein product [Adineta steineri]
MIICAILINRNLRLKRQRHRQLDVNNQVSNEQNQRKRDQQAFVMLLLHAIVFLATQTSWMVVYFYTVATGRLAIEQFISSSTDRRLLLFLAILFYLYILTSR